MNLRKLLIFLTLLVLLVGVVNAAESGDSTSSDDVSGKVMHKTSTASSTDFVKENTGSNNNLKSNKQNNNTIKENTKNVIQKDDNKVVDKESEEKVSNDNDKLSNVSSAKEDATSIDENIQNNTNALVLNDTNTELTSDESDNAVNSLDDLNNITTKFNSINKKNKELVKEWSVIDSVTDALDQISTDLSSRIKNSKEALDSALKNIIGSFDNVSKNLSEQLDILREKIDSIYSEDESIAEQIENARTLLDNLTQFNERFAEKLQEYDGKVSNISDSIISALDGTNKNLTEKITDLLKNGVDLPEEIINEISKLNTTFNDLVSKIKDIDPNIFNVTDILNKLNNTNLTELLKDAEGELQKICEFIESLFKPSNTTITVNPVKSNVGSVTKLSANIVDSKGENVTEGRVFFKVNGVTLKDKSNNVLYGIVSNGTASINYKVQDAWVKNTTYIEAVYGGSDKYASSRTNSSQALNIGKGTAKLTLQNSAITAKSGDAITLTARVKDASDDPINTGKVIFKLNGKTITDEEGNTLFAKVVNGEAILNYVIPTKYTAKKYTLTAVYGGDYYERTEAKGTLTLEKKGVTINTDSVTAVKGKASIKATITDETGKLLVTSTKLTIKINGKTILTNVNSTDGIIDVNFVTTLNPGMYELLIISGENGIYKTGRMTTVLNVLS